MTFRGSGARTDRIARCFAEVISELLRVIQKEFMHAEKLMWKIAVVCVGVSATAVLPLKNLCFFA